MRARNLTVLALATALALFHGAGTAHAGKKLRDEVTRLRGDIAHLSTQLNFMQRDMATRPAGYPGGGLCDDPCAVDSDEDGVDDCNDYCPCDPNTADSDADGMPDCADPCPDDATDACIDPCRMDSDGDGITDCEDQCPWDPAPAVDTDSDGIVDCQDPCPEDATNECWDPCKLDQDGDNVPDCEDDCPWPGDPAGGVCLPPPSVGGGGNGDSAGMTPASVR